MQVSKLFAAAALSVGSLLSGQALAEGSSTSTEIGLYGFGSAITGDSTIGNVTADLDISFSDILDDLEFGFMGFVDHRRGNWSFIADIVFMELSSVNTLASTPIASAAVGYGFKQSLAEFFVGYRIFEERSGNTGVSVDVLGGVRYNKLDVTLDARAAALGLVAAASRTRDESWVDGVIGLRGAYDFGNGWGVNGWVDVGAGDDSASYQAALMASYTFDNNVKLFGGYRYYHFDYKTSGGARAFAIDADYSGPVLGISYQF